MKRQALLIAGVMAALTIVHFTYVDMGMYVASPLVMLDSIWIVGLLTVVLFASSSIGAAIVDAIGLDFDGNVGRIAWIVALGYGAVMTILALMAAVGIFWAWSIWVAFAVAVLAAARWWRRALDAWLGLCNDVAAAVRGGGLVGMAVIASGLIGLGALPRLMAPPDSYDALMYHLPAPRAFLEAGGFVVFPYEVQANYPLGFDMFYALGLAADADRFGRLMHFSCLALLLLAVYDFSRRYFGHDVAAMSVMILLGSAKVSLIGTWIFTDMAYALFGFLAVDGFVRWWTGGAVKWLAASGIVAGLAMATKYYGLRIGLLLGSAILLVSLIRGRSARRGIARAVGFGAFALVMAGVWYVKNAFLLGNPVYPFIFGGLNWNPVRAEFWRRWSRTFSYGSGAWEFLLLPVYVILHPDVFSATPGGYFNPWMLLAPMGWFLKGERTGEKSRSVNRFLMLYVLAQFYLWGLQLRELRYLTAIFPFVSICAGWVIFKSVMWALGSRMVKSALMVGLWLPVLFATSAHIFASLPTGYDVWPYLVGAESAAEYLRDSSYAFRLAEFMDENLPDDAKVLFFFEGQYYYCRRECIPDPIYDRWVDWSARYGTDEGLLRRMCAEGFTHVAVNEEWLYPAPDDREAGLLGEESVMAFEAFLDRYLEPVPGAREAGFALYGLRCQIAEK